MIRTISGPKSALLSALVWVLGAMPASADVIFDNWNIFGVASGPATDTVFTLTDTYQITSVENYHYWYDNPTVSDPWDGAGDPAGTFSIMFQNTSTLAIFDAGTITTSGGTNPYSDWLASPVNLILGPGTYRVLDPHMASWSYNSSSSGQGFSRIQGTIDVPGPATFGLFLFGLAVVRLNSARKRG